MRIVSTCLILIGLGASSATADTRCFDDRRFCFAVEPDDNGYSLSLYRGDPLPVVVTLYSSQLPSHHVTHFLNDDRHIELTHLSNPAQFWQSMQVRWTPGVLNATHDDSVRYSSPLKGIENHPVVQGYNGNYSHTGGSRYALDFAADVGTPVYAARAGIVIDTKSDSNTGGPSEDFARQANYVALLHDDGTTGEYYHLKYHGVNVERGEQVARGALIGYSGNTGFSSLPHLHFAVYRAKGHGQFESLPIRFTAPLASKSHG